MSCLNSTCKTNKIPLLVYGATWVIGIIAAGALLLFTEHNCLDGISLLFVTALTLQLFWVVWLHWSKRFPSYTEMSKANTKTFMSLAGVTAVLTIYFMCYIWMDRRCEIIWQEAAVAGVLGCIFTIIMLSPKRDKGGNMAFASLEILFLTYFFLFAGLSLNKSLASMEPCDTFETTVGRKGSEWGTRAKTSWLTGNHYEETVLKYYAYLEEPEKIYGVSRLYITEEDYSMEEYNQLEEGTPVVVTYYRGLFGILLYDAEIKK